ncbi:MAG TPA: HAD-IIA family hydrolase [Acidimicrobiales bacterium]|nr:HAD-IIA family hydrolase [Acidimicrobiales bacterium]
MLDLDGVVWRGDAPVAGAATAVADLRAAGERVLFVTNNALPTRAAVAAKLAGHGIDPGDDVVTSPMAVATLVEPGERVLLCAGPGARDALVARGAETVDAGDPGALGGAFDAVVVGLHLDFDYARLDAASRAARAGARLIATNDDATYPGEHGLSPGAGSLLAAVTTASGIEPTVAGKPFAPMVELVRSLAGPDGVVVGDRADTDGRFARALGYRFGLVLTGVTRPEDLPVVPAPDAVGDDLGALVDRWIAGPW